MPKKIGADHGPIDKDAPQPMIKAAIDTIVAALCHERLALSAMNAVETSCKKIHEVIAAMNRIT